MIYTLGYADDLALIEYGDADGIAKSSARVSSISEGSNEEADMSLSIPKTKVLHVRKQDAVSPTTPVGSERCMQIHIQTYWL